MTLSLKLSQRLHELGVVVESAMMFINYGDKRDHDIRGPMEMDKSVQKKSRIPAPDFEELWKVMPNRMYHQDLFHRKGDNGKSIIGYSWIGNMNETLQEYAHESPTEALGMLLCWLAENGHVKGDKDGQ